MSDIEVVGFPRALLFYELYPFWRTVFEAAGQRLVLSRPTTRELLEAGTRRAVDEACLPVKAFYGHVMSLRDEVDAIFLPRLVSLRRGTYTCPKLLGLPDMIRHNVGKMPAAIVANVDETKPGRGLFEAGAALARRLGLQPGLARLAARRGLEALRAFRRVLCAGGEFGEALEGSLARPGSGQPACPAADGLGAAGGDHDPAAGGTGRASGGPRPRIGLVGHPYNLFDPGINLGLVKRLQGLGCEVLTSEALADEEVQAESERLPKELFWSSGRRILSAVTVFRSRRLVDGIIHIVSFGCGPDSMVGEIAERETRRYSDLSYMVLTIDEHTAEAGLVTRVEAFVDMLGRRGAQAAPLGPGLRAPGVGAR